MTTKSFQIILCALAMFIASGCSSDQEPQEKRTHNDSLPEYTIVVIEGCEYFRFLSTHGYVHITHKGNCKNPIHFYNKNQSSERGG